MASSHQNQVEAVALVPLMLQRMLRQDPGALAALHCIIAGSAPLNPALALLGADPAFVRSGRDARAVARLLVNISIGLRVQAKITPDRAALEDIVVGALAAVG